MRGLIVSLLLVLTAPAMAMSLALAKVERAEEGETEQQVCDRALARMTEELHGSLLSVIAATDAYEQRRLAYRDQGLEESLLDDAYLSQLFSEKPEVKGRRWTGSRCSVRARYEADIDALAVRVPLPMATPAPAANSDNPPPPGVDEKTWELFSSSRDRAELSQVFSTVAALRVQIVEYYAMTGGWPEDLASIGVAPEQLVSKRIKRAYLLKDGLLKFELAGRLAGHSLSTWPTDVGVRGVEWQCTTTVNMGPNNFCEQVE
ncbi:pilin [Alcanivorax sediminis]|uniref:Uncharacterized protein n=1 Tax=Alcanivorax sediminis TaxID=2663008 RepID=A0A6N7LRB8_9GAMM|nr:pilin [Alcanivorax sediminis]MQX52773.1 hypothetical protein [Alcanivorax sediminis]